MATAMLIGGLGISATAGSQEFLYNGDNGPGFWSELSPDWGACAGIAEDARQSPINIRRVRYDKSLRRLQLVTYATTIDLINNGHTIEQHYEDTGSSIYFEGRQYDLLQFHFHTLSEHAIAGQQGAMEMHAVFSEAGSEDKLVVGTLFKVRQQANPFLQTLIDAGLPEKDGDSTESDESINLSDGLTKKSAYYTYPGSLTTPPCTENVTWIILKKSAKMTSEQYDAFRGILGNDFRPLQDLNGRVVRATKN
jgi:carbonic anhydrase